MWKIGKNFFPRFFYIHYLDKYLYLSLLLWSKTTLIASCVGGKGANPPTQKMRKNFLMSLALSMPIYRNF